MSSDNRVKVSVLVPVYGVEKYIERCARSLFEQTMKDGIEFIFTDDCTRDRSIEILEKVLEEYPERKSQVKIIHHEKNQGLVSARVTGLKEAVGEYVIHCDSDDWVEREMYEIMYRQAKDTDSDIVVCDFLEGDDTLEVYRHQNIPESRISIFKSILDGTLHAAMWNKMLSHRLIDRLGVKVNPEINMWEDMAYMTPHLLSGCRMTKVDKALYHYVCVQASMSRTFSLRSVNSQIKAVDNISGYVEADPELSTILSLLKLKSKDYFLLRGESYNPALWRQTFPEANKEILNENIPPVKRLLYYLCEKHLDFAVKLLAGLRKK
ncbi:MAG: glycosyltransferase family 2 protein [Bacteroides sp.]|nr:glycosyltransferase family 2 protein [Bacteroides sp.]